QHIAVGQDDVVPEELGVARPEREPRALLEFRVHDVSKRHAAMGRPEGPPDHLLAVPDDEGGLVHPGGLEPVEEARQKASPSELDQALGPLVGERSQALADARREDEASHGFFPLLVAESSNLSSSSFALSRLMRSA